MSSYNYCFYKLSIAWGNTQHIGPNLILVGKLNTSYDHYCPKLTISRKNSTRHHTVTVSLNLVLSGGGGGFNNHTTTIGLNLILVGKLNRTSYDHSFYKLSTIREISTHHPTTTISINLVLRGGILNTSYDHYWSKLNISGKTQHLIRPLLV